MNPTLNLIHQELNLNPQDMLIPFDCFCGIGEVWKGDYDCSKMTIQGHPVVVDIGANCGAFALWAAHFWKASKVICYEPNPDIFSYLKYNTGIYHSIHPECEFELHEMAVGDDRFPLLYVDQRNRLCSSQYDTQREGVTAIPVKIERPINLPDCDVLKMDCEGAEGYIASCLTIFPKYVALEYHSPMIVGKCVNHLTARGYSLIDTRIDNGGQTGILKFIKS